MAWFSKMEAACSYVFLVLDAFNSEININKA
jgi:hypothetical protein